MNLSRNGSARLFPASPLIIRRILVLQGADDCLVKAWKTSSGVLLATMRGHEVMPRILSCAGTAASDGGR